MLRKLAKYNCFFRCIVVLFALLLLGISGLFLTLRFAIPWLGVVDSPKQADAIVVLAGESTRAFYAADLYHKGWASNVIITRPIGYPSAKMLDGLGISIPSTEEIFKQVLIKKGVPANRIFMVGKDVISTLQEAESVKSFSRPLNRILIVTSLYHARRARMIFHDVLPSVEINVIATPYEPMPSKWWTDQDASRNVLLELAKISFYTLGGKFRSGPTVDSSRYKVLEPAK